MDKKLRIAGIIAALAFSIFYLTFSSDPLPIPEPPSSKPENNSVEILAENLDEPRSIAVSDNRIFVTEKDGLIRVIQDNVLLDEPLATLRPANVFDGGLLGIALHPDFSNHHRLIVEFFQIMNQDLEVDVKNQKQFQFLHTICYQDQILKIHH